MNQPGHGRQLTAARTALDLSMQDIADLAGVHPQSVFNSEHRGRLPPRSKAAGKIGEAFAGLGVSFEARPDGYAVVFGRALNGATPKGSHG